jgi:hypothetical protein
MISDVNFRKTKALPAAAATAYSDSLDLGAVTPGPVGSSLLMRISVPALPALVEDKTVTLNLQHSADDSTFVNVPTTGNMVVTGGSGNGADAVAFDFYLPPNVLRYIRASAAVLTAGGDNTGVSFGLEGLI